MTVASLLVFAGALFLAASAPGPTVAALVARVLSRGYRDVLPFLAALWIGEAIWLTLAIAGLATIAERFQLAFVLIKWAGVAYLLYLAFKMWTAPAKLDDGATPDGMSGFSLFFAGLSVALGNPKNMMFYMALLPTLIDLGKVTPTGWAELVAVMFAVLACVDLSWTFFAARARLFLKSPRAVRFTNRVSALTMAGAAAAIAARS